MVDGFWYVFCGKMGENMEKSAVFPGGYGRIGEIPHGRLCKMNNVGRGFLFLAAHTPVLIVHGWHS